MGQAKQRGTLEQRVAEGTQKRIERAAQKLVERQAYLDSIKARTPKEKKTSAKLAAMIGFLAGSLPDDLKNFR